MFNFSKIRPVEPCNRYQEKAFECLRALENVGDPAGRVDLLQIAQHWLRLAEHVARRAQRMDLGGARHHSSR